MSKATTSKKPRKLNLPHPNYNLLSEPPALNRIVSLSEIYMLATPSHSTILSGRSITSPLLSQDIVIPLTGLANLSNIPSPIMRYRKPLLNKLALTSSRSQTSLATLESLDFEDAQSSSQPLIDTIQLTIPLQLVRSSSVTQTERLLKGEPLRQLFKHIEKNNLTEIKRIFNSTIQNKISLFEFNSQTCTSIISFAYERKQSVILSFFLGEIDLLLAIITDPRQKAALLVNKALASNHFPQSSSSSSISDRCYEEVLSYDAQLPSAYFYHGLHILETSLTPEALEIAVHNFTWIIENLLLASFSPSVMSAVYLNRGIAYAKLDNLDQAQKDLNQAISINEGQQKDNKNILA
jgi:tetratricopeptide (TPR) repeat protein